MSAVLTTIDLDWKPYNVDVEAVHLAFKQKYPTDGYCGASADSQLHLHFTTVLPQEEIDEIAAYWDAIIETSPEAVNYGTKKVAAQYLAAASSAIDFGQAVVKQFAGENLQLGITQAGMTKTVRLAMAEVIDCLQTGSLIEAIAELKAIPQTSYDSTFITAARLLAAVNKLESFVGLPLSTSFT